jgi:hypothetical protein
MAMTTCFLREGAAGSLARHTILSNPLPANASFQDAAYAWQSGRPTHAVAIVTSHLRAPSELLTL